MQMDRMIVISRVDEAPDLRGSELGCLGNRIRPLRVVQ
jgi:hypothetical protein